MENNPAAEAEISSTDESIAPSAPADAQAVFGSRLELAERYANLLAGPAVERGLLGPSERDRLWNRHVLNSAVVGELMPAGAEVVDVGSGAGLPGMALAIARPDLRVTLVESRLRPTVFLSECVDILGLSSVTVRRARAEDLVEEVRADVVTARAVGSLKRLIEWGLPLLRTGGQLLAFKGQGAGTELTAARPALERLGGRDPEVLHVGPGDAEYATTVVRVVAGQRSPGRKIRRK